MGVVQGEDEGRGAGEGRKAELSLMSWVLLRFLVLKPFSMQGNIFTAGKLPLKLHLLPKAIDVVLCNLWVALRARENGKTRLKAERSSQKQYLNVSHEWVARRLYTILRYGPAIQ